jgi:ribosome maturation factor RimP
MDLAQRIEDLIAPSIGAMGFDVVRVLISGKQRMRLQIMAEWKNGRTVTVENCAQLSRAISAVLDVEDPILEAYTLEVSSPGIDRPLVRLVDFERFAGFDARVETNEPVDGHRRFRGRLLGTVGEAVRLDLGDSVHDIPYGAIARAKLLLTDELLAAARSTQQH